MLQEFSDWLSHSDLTAFFSDTTRLETWLIIPMSQTLHILAVAVILVPIAMLNLQLLGVKVTRQSFAQLSVQSAPWIWAALIVLLLTGVVQTIAEPNREIMNLAFRTKIVALLITVGITTAYFVQVKKDPKYWERTSEHRNLGRALAGLSLVLWIGIGVAGRLIAYWGAIES